MGVRMEVIYFWLGMLLMGKYGLQAMAQQLYSQDYSEDCDNFHAESSGYLCNGAAKECSTFALYRAQQFYMSLDSIASLSNTDPATIAAASNLSLTNYSQPLRKDQSVLFPIDCKCASNFSQANLTYTVKHDDTYLKIANQTLEGLATCQAMREQNPSHDEYSLETGMKLVAPLRCACPTPKQLAQGVKYLLSYIPAYEDDDDIITAKFNILRQDLISANSLEESNPLIYPDTTLLIPLNHTPTVPPDGPLAPPPPTRFPPSPPLVLNPQRPSSNSHSLIIVLIASLAAALLLVVAILVAAFLFCKRRKRRKIIKITPLHNLPGAEAKKLEFTEGPQESKLLLSELADLLDSDGLIQYSFKELLEATDNFSEAHRIKGSVFSGILRGKTVAMKQMKGQIYAEINLLTKLHHANLVTLVGICLSQEDQHTYLVFEYAENGCLSDWIHGARSPDFLTWKQRLQIAVDIAKGLEYLHHGTSPSCIHKDLRSSNVLLDLNFRAEIANFGLAKSGGGVTAVTSHIIGTHGYMAPEFLRDGLVTPKLDVFAFGVILLEILSGKTAIESSRVGDGERALSDEIINLLQGENPREKLCDWIDLNMGGLYDLEAALKVAYLAKSCVEKDLSLRPSATEIRVELSKLAGISTVNSSAEWRSTATMSSEIHPR